jgi:hypothetical protein
LAFIQIDDNAAIATIMRKRIVLASASNRKWAAKIA